MTALSEAIRPAVEEETVLHDEASFSSRAIFRIDLAEDEIDGGWVATCLDFPGCRTEGATKQEALENLVEAILGVLEVRMQRRLQDDPAVSMSATGSRHIELTV